MRARRSALVLAGMALLLVSAPATTAAPPTLVGTVQESGTISLTRGDKPVKRLRAGTYRIVVRDRTGHHNFRLRGPGVNRATAVSDVVTRTWTVRLRKGSWTYICDPHPVDMRGTFRVV